jgi:hypothetical protein
MTTEEQIGIMTQRLRDEIEKQATEEIRVLDEAKKRLQASNETLEGFREKEKNLLKEIDEMKFQEKKRLLSSIKDQQSSRDDLFNKRVSLTIELQVCRELISETEDSLQPELQGELERTEKILGDKLTRIFIETGNNLELALNEIIENQVEPMIVAWPKAVFEIQKDLNVNSTYRELRIENATVRDHCDGF